jgi:DNA-3-methyladenine glycosylase I
VASYCDIAPGHPLHGPYHDHEYGFPVSGDDALFERLVLEIQQAGLSWATILAKRAAFREAFDGFDVARVARFSERSRERLMQNAAIIRNRKKIEAAVANAATIVAIQKTHGSFAKWLETHHPRGKDEWVRLFRKTFVFTGGEITGSFLMSIGYLPGAHETWCPVYAEVLRNRPAWSMYAA